jgi:hypothetical protein
VSRWIRLRGSRSPDSGDDAAANEAAGEPPATQRSSASFRRVATRRALAVIALVVITVAVAGAGVAATTLYGQFGGGRAAVNAKSWAMRPLTYSLSDCRSCHADQSTAETTGPHRVLICQACHVPTVDHPGPISGTVAALEVPKSALCVTCHSDAAGRPIGLAQVDLSQHYPGADCLRCHDPHTTIAATAPGVTHPLANLPDCVTCHAPGRLKRFPQGHEPAADSVCLTCHLTPDRRL